MSLQIFSTMEMIFFAFGCLLTIAALLYINHRQKSIRPVYPIICLQNQSFIWLALRLENDQEFHEDFEKSISDKILHIWFLQLFIIICALLIHILMNFLQKVMKKIHCLDGNSTLKIMLRYITDHELIEKQQIKCIKKIISILQQNTMTRCLNNVKSFITNYLFTVIFDLIPSFMILFVVSFFLALVVITAVKIFDVYKGYSLLDRLTFLFRFIVKIMLTIAFIVIAVAVAWFMVKVLVKLFKRVKHFLFFLFVFVAYYCFIFYALFLIGSKLSFGQVKAIRLSIGFAFLGFACIKLFFYWKKSKQQ